MTLSTWEMEAIKNEVAEAREFYRQRMDADIPPMQEEIVRLSRAVGELTEQQRVGERRALLANYGGGGGGDRARVPFGKYRGMDALDLACVRSVLAAQQREPGEGNPRILEDWQANLKAAMDSASCGQRRGAGGHRGSGGAVGGHQPGYAHRQPVHPGGYAHQSL